jgi:hypothetical protein
MAQGHISLSPTSTPLAIWALVFALLAFASRAFVAYHGSIS